MCMTPQQAVKARIAAKAAILEQYLAGAFDKDTAKHLIAAIDRTKTT